MDSPKDLPPLDLLASPLASGNGDERIFFEAIVASVPAGIALVRLPDFVYELVNPVFQAFAAGKPMLGRRVDEVWPEVGAELRARFERVARTGERFHERDALFRVRRSPEGPLIEAYFTFDFIPLARGDGRVHAILVVALETTDQVESRRRIERLAESLARRAGELRGVLDNMMDAVLACDAGGTITLANEAARELFGESGGALVGATLDDLARLFEVGEGRRIERGDLPLARALAGQTVALQVEAVIDPHVGKRTDLRTSATPIRGERGEIVGAVAVSRDVTEAAELERLKDQFVRVAAHELRTPVTILRGYVQALMRLGDRPPPVRMLAAIHEGVDRIEWIVKALLAVSEIEVGRLDLVVERVDLDELIGRVIAQVAAGAPLHRVRLVETEPVSVRGDRERLKQVVATLLENAVRYSPKGGDVDVRIRAQGGEVLVEVRDQGVGIPRDKQARIFQRLYRAHTDTPAYDFGGMGVGLFIARAIVERHGGQMWFESEEGEGSTFSFTLPRLGAEERVEPGREAPAAMDTAPTHAPSSHPRGGPRISARKPSHRGGRQRG